MAGICRRFDAAFAMWNPVGIVSLLATIANIGLVAATLMPWGQRFFPPH